MIRTHKVCLCSPGLCSIITVFLMCFSDNAVTGRIMQYSFWFGIFLDLCICICAHVYSAHREGSCAFLQSVFFVHGERSIWNLIKGEISAAVLV